MNKTVSIYELIYNRESRPIGLKLIERCPPCEKQHSSADNIVVECIELSLDSEKSALDIYDKVIKSGRPVHFEAWHQTTQRCYDVFSSSYGERENKMAFADMKMMSLLINVNANRSNFFSDQSQLFHWPIHRNITM